MECRIVSLDDQTWRIEEFDAKDSVYLYLLAGGRSALLLDTGFGQIDVPAAVTALTCLPLTVVHSHGHFDHIGGDRSFEAVYLHPADRPLYDLHRARLPQPGSARVLDLTDGQLFDLGGRTLEVLHVPGHSPGSVCLLDRERRWLFTGDTCCKADVLLCLEYSGTVTEYASSIAKLQARRDAFDCTWPATTPCPWSRPFWTSLPGRPGRCWTALPCSPMRRPSEPSAAGPGRHRNRLHRGDRPLRYSRKTGGKSMAICTIEYFSNNLRQFTKFKAILPNDLPPEMVAGNPHFQRPMQTLILLHGYSGSETDWLYNTQISRWPDGTIWPFSAPTAATASIWTAPRPGGSTALSSARAAGLCRPALRPLPGPGRYLHRRLLHGRLRRDPHGSAISGAVFQGDFLLRRPDPPPRGRHDPRDPGPHRRTMPITAISSRSLPTCPPASTIPKYLTDALLARGTPLPQLFLAVGFSDFLYEDNQSFLRFLSDRGVNYRYVEGPASMISNLSAPIWRKRWTF